MKFAKVESSPSFPKLEESVLARWQAERTFQRSLERTKQGEEFIFYDGPPFPTGAPHHGTIFVSVLKDVIPRYKTMRGYYVPRTWGWDCHGLPIETAAEKSLGIKDKSEIFKIGVKAFNDECRRLVSTYNDAWRLYIDRIGRWVDMDNPYRTLDLKFMESVIWAFSECYKKQLIYKDYRVSPYCYRCETPLSISETRLDDSTRPKQDRSVTVRFPVVGEVDTYYLIWTTTPWTLPSNLAIAIGAEIEYVVALAGDGKRYILAEKCLPSYKKELGEVTIERRITGKELAAEGRKYNPIFNYFAQNNPNGFKPLIGEFVSTEDGTGIVHCAPAFGEDDYWICRRNNIGVVNPVDEHGCYTEAVKDFVGKNVHEANPEIVRYLKTQGSLVKDATVEHNYPHCWRCRNPLIYRAIDAWYLNVEQIKESLIQNNEKIAWYPETVRSGRFGKWLENARDWNISRNRFWATPIPVWQCSGCKRLEALSSVAEIEQKSGSKVNDLHKEYLDQIQYSCDCGGTMKRVPEVLDCWFESGSMPYGQWHYPFENADHFRSHFPSDFIVEYTGQIRGWFYVLHVLSTALFGCPAFKHCLVHGTLLAADGKKMSKSLKNYTDPLELVNRYGADALRAYLLSSNAVNMNDLSFRDDGVEGMIKSIFLPLWNALSFFTTYAEIDGIDSTELELSRHRKGLTELDRFILSETERLTAALTDKLDNYLIGEATRLFPDFLDSLNNWYIRRSRERVWGSDPRSVEKLSFYSTCYHVLSKLAQLLAPFCPFIAESVWERLGNKESVHLCNWPAVEPDSIDQKLSSEITLTRKIISAGLAIRAREKIRVRQPLSLARVAINLAIDLTPYLEAITEELNLKKLEFVRDPAQISQKVGKANAKLLGPKFGSKVQEIIKAAKAGNFSEMSDGSIQVGEFNLAADEIEIGFVGKEGLAVESIDGNVVALDLQLTPELILEGHARDLVRQIQEFRKEADLQIADRIILSVTGADEVMKSFGEYVKQETLTREIVPVVTSPILSKRLEVGELQVEVAFKRE